MILADQTTERPLHMKILNNYLISVPSDTFLTVENGKTEVDRVGQLNISEGNLIQITFNLEHQPATLSICGRLEKTENR